jgi:hypothetical protein
MNRRAMMSNVFGMSCGVCGLAAMLLLGGCNGEPTGDAAYSQKFEVPPEAAHAANLKSALPSPSRAEEREKDKANVLKRQLRQAKQSKKRRYLS